MKNKKLVGILAFFPALLLAMGVAYAQPYRYPHIDKYGPYSDHYDIGAVYGGSIERVDSASELYQKGIFPVIIVLGTPNGVKSMKQRAIANGVPEGSIILPVQYSLNTIQNVQSLNETIKECKLGNKVAHISGVNHLPRIKGINDTLSKDSDPTNDGFFPVADGYGENPRQNFLEYVKNLYCRWILRDYK